MQKKRKKSALYLKVLPSYTGKNYKFLEDVLLDKTARKILWLEILFNDSIHWENYLQIPSVKKNYSKAGQWYKHFKTMLKIFGINRKPLPEFRGKVLMKDYRKFIEALYYLH